MRILLDENAPSGLRRILAGHDVRSAPEMGWARYSNGQLLDEAEQAGFDALITGDQNLAFQHTLTGRNIAVIIWKPPITVFLAGARMTARAASRIEGSIAIRSQNPRLGSGGFHMVVTADLVAQAGVICSRRANHSPACCR